jgi:multisubunit Na+/H+ antiporter MnhG subunit
MIAAVKDLFRRTPWPQGFRASSKDAPVGAPDTADRAGFFLLLGAVGLAPLAGLAPDRLAGLGPVAVPVPQLGQMLLQVLAFLAAALAFLSRARARSLRPLRVPLIAFAAFAAFGVLQLIPLPDGFLGFVAPVNRGIYHDTVEVLGLFRVPAPLPRISIAPSETIGAVGTVLACFALFLASANLVAGRDRLRTFATVIVLSAVVRIVIALTAPASVDAHATGAHGEIALAICFGAVWTEALTGGGRVRHDADRAEWFEGRVLPLALRLAIWTGVALGIAWTGSKATAPAAVATTVLLALAGTRHRRARSQRRVASAFAVAAALVLLAGATAGASFLFRRGPHSPAPVPSDIHSLLEAWRLFPVLGSGLGTLPDALRRVQPPGAPSIGAAGDAFQILVTGGVIGATLAALSLLSLFALLFSAWRSQRHRGESAFILAGLGAMFSLALLGAAGGALVDPTVALSLAAVTGAAWAAGRAT